MRPIFVAVWLAAGIAFAIAAEAASRAEKLYGHWKAADRDGDRELSRDEAAAMPALSPHFDAIDRSQDGRISADEVRAWKRSVAAARRKPPRNGPEAYFTRADADGDGALSPAEAQSGIPGIARKFERLDRDGNARVTREEFDAWMAQRRRSAAFRRRLRR